MTKLEQKLRDALIEIFVSNNNHIEIVCFQGIKCLAIQVNGQIELVPITDDTYNIIQKVIGVKRVWKQIIDH